jgi:hypothetical protein
MLETLARLISRLWYVEDVENRGIALLFSDELVLEDFEKTHEFDLRPTMDVSTRAMSWNAG